MNILKVENKYRYTVVSIGFECISSILNISNIHPNPNSFMLSLKQII